MECSLKGPRLIIPGELQEEYLSRLHEGHLSANKVQENAKQHYVLDRNQCGHRRLHQEIPGMYQKVSGTQGAPPASWHSRGSLEETWYWLFLPSMAAHMSWSVITSPKFPLPLQSQNIILVIKGPSNQHLFNWRVSRRDSIRQRATVSEQGVCQISLRLRHQAHHLITRVSPL